MENLAIMLAAVLLPAVQMAREAARRSFCSNNLRQVGLALLNYESARGSFPAGGFSTPEGGFGFSWWALILPYIEQDDIFDRLDKKGPTLGFVGHEGNQHNREVLHGADFPFMSCPSSTLPRYVLRGAVNENANVISPCMPAWRARRIIRPPAIRSREEVRRGGFRPEAC